MAENKPAIELAVPKTKTPMETTYDRAQRLARTLPGKQNAVTPADIEHYIPEAEKQLVEERNKGKV